MQGCFVMKVYNLQNYFSIRVQLYVVHEAMNVSIWRAQCNVGRLKDHQHTFSSAAIHFAKLHFNTLKQNRRIKINQSNSPALNTSI